MKKILLAVLVALAAGPLFARGRAEEQAPQALVINTIKGPSGIGMIKLFETPPRISGFTVTIEAFGSQDIIAAKFVSGEAQAGILPANMAAKLAASGVPVQIAAIVGNGMLSLLTSDPEIRGIADLRGQSVEVTGRGATPEYVFRRILLAWGLDPDRDLTMTFTLSYPEIAQSLIAGRLQSALLPEPFATMARLGNPALRQVADIQEEWVRAGGPANYPMIALVVNRDFAGANPGAVRTLLEDYRASTEWVVAHPAEAGVLTERYELGLRAPVVEAAVPRSNYVFLPAREARPAIEALFRVFLENDPASIGGALPPEDFYF
ncbi:MAG: ABC transporter substrate-binding protein [Spirochaetaceae bacterium]|jgi:NitT/TauT family transport system substrate-binding protein|nr:ABC transporter substrate-binding protein [Spirochaetaceae bacterium]